MICNENDSVTQYREILELAQYCEKIGVEVRLEPLYDGYAIQFKNGADMVQHKYSYGSNAGCIEPAIGSICDYHAVALSTAKRLIRHRRRILNKPLE